MRMNYKLQNPEGWYFVIFNTVFWISVLTKWIYKINYHHSQHGGNSGFLAFVLLMVSFLATGQESRKYDRFDRKIRYEAAIITSTQGTRYECQLRMGDGFYQDGLSQVVLKSGDKKELSIDSVSSIQVGSVLYETIGNKYYQVLFRGDRIVLFRNEITEVVTHTDGTNTKMVYDNYLIDLIGERKHFVPLDEREFAAFSRIFTSCPSVFDKTINKELGRKDILQIVKAYNDCREPT